MVRGLFVLLALLLCGDFARADNGNGAPIGRWITANGDAVVQIAPCGAGVCGQIVGILLAHPNDPMPLDWRGNPQCGLTIIETAPVADADGNVQWKGTVLDPRNGNVYQANIALDQDRHLRLHGYIGLPIFGQTQVWTPFSGRTLGNCKMAATVMAGAGA